MFEIGSYIKSNDPNSITWRVSGKTHDNWLIIINGFMEMMGITSSDPKWILSDEETFKKEVQKYFIEGKKYGD